MVAWLFVGFVFLATSVSGTKLVQPVVYCSTDGVLDVTLTVGVTLWRTSAFEFFTRAYDDSVPGPTLVVSPGDTLNINIVNTLEEPIASGEANTLHSPNTTNIHLHGLHIYSEGHQDNIFLAADPGRSLSLSYTIPSDHPSGTYWYHPHFHGSSAVQISGGMAGALIVLDRDEETTPDEFKLMTDVVLLFQEAVFAGKDEEGNIVLLNNQTDSRIHMKLRNSGTQNKYITVNGHILPAHSMKQHEVQRLRFINAAVHNFIFPVFPKECEVKLIAMDGIYLKAPVDTNRLILPGASRADVLISCSSTGPYTINSEYKTVPDLVRNVPGVKVHTLEGALFYLHIQAITSDNKPKLSTMPTTLPPLPLWMSDLMSEENFQTFSVEFSTSQFQINGEWFTDETPQTSLELDSVYEWRVWRDDPMNHPYHQHINHFQLAKYDGDHLPYNVTGKMLGMWRDTIPLGDTDTLIRFKPSHFPGRMMFHCHLSVHADKGMMAYANISGDYSESMDPPKNSVKTIDYQNCYEIVPEPDEPDEPEGPGEAPEDDGPPDNLYPRVQPKPQTKSEKLRAILPYGISGILALLGFAIIGYFWYQHRSDQESRFGREELELITSEDEGLLD